MLTRRLLAALALVVVGIFSFAGVAGAAEGGLTHEAEHCIEVLEEGGEPADCHEAPSPIFPEWNEVIWGGISFTILLLALYKFALPGLKGMMEQRTERIRADLDEADKAKTEADRIRQEYSAQLADAKAEAGRIIEEARQAADSVRRDLTQRAEQEAAELRQRNAEQLDAERARLMSEMQGQVAALAIELAEKVVEANLDRDTNTRLIESYIQQVGQR
ncbi:MAG TPA: F0F1 ATP synthase subunit B [Acidimicrobiales bacterium]|nr:F0F1 ATP synthase subunit B [Acidimicrobiales bacterium]